jgi:two-component system, LytTR family, sensor histidine kinase AgrC
VRAMLNYKLSAAKEKNILLRLSIDVPEGLALPEFDLTVILGNLLDNAVEACMTIEKDSRYIELSIRYEPDYLIIQNENPVNGLSAKQGGNRRTTKPDAEYHGYGLQNIEFLTQKYNGFVKLTRGNDVFKADIALLIRSGQNPDNALPAF